MSPQFTKSELRKRRLYARKPSQNKRPSCLNQQYLCNCGVHLLDAATGEPLAPLIHGPASGLHATLSFLANNNREAFAFVTSSSLGPGAIELHKLKLHPDLRNPTKLEQLSMVLSGLKIGENNNLMPIPIEILRQLWKHEGLGSPETLRSSKEMPQ